jgi:hypothetical protein
MLRIRAEDPRLLANRLLIVAACNRNRLGRRSRLRPGREARDVEPRPCVDAAGLIVSRGAAADHVVGAALQDVGSDAWRTEGPGVDVLRVGAGTVDLGLDVTLPGLSAGDVLGGVGEGGDGETEGSDQGGDEGGELHLGVEEEFWMLVVDCAMWCRMS